MALFVPLARLRIRGPLPSPMAAIGMGEHGRPEPTAMPDLASFDLIVVSTSGGKDSQVALDVVVTEARRLGILDRVTAVHADLGADEWQGTTDLVRMQAQHYGVPLVICSRIGQLKSDRPGKLYETGDTFGDLHDYVRRRKQAHVRGDQASKPAWYSPAIRYCTSEFKRSPIRAATQQLISAWRERTGLHSRACRVLSVQGLRADESSRRAKRVPFELDAAFSTGGREAWSASTGSPLKTKRGGREVWTWLPIHRWSSTDVWAAIRDSGAPYHWAYDVGMPRLSCSLCIFAPESALILAGHYNHQRLAEKADLERETGDTFKLNLALGDVLAKVDAGEWPSVSDWTM
jgi:3'-phosphoadenosine 5'-phosphosulfate sulfotransferase (PAPS reductase)/FAD synthetase